MASPWQEVPRDVPVEILVEKVRRRGIMDGGLCRGAASASLSSVCAVFLPPLLPISSCASSHTNPPFCTCLLTDDTANQRIELLFLLLVVVPLHWQVVKRDVPVEVLVEKVGRVKGSA